MMKISQLILITLLLLSKALYAQYESPDSSIEEDNTKKKENTSDGRRIFFGGNLGLSFGTYTYIQIAPTIGYKFTPRLRAGIGPEYIYMNWREIQFKSSIYGLRTFASFSIFKDINEVINLNISDIFLYAENELLNIESFRNDTSGYVPAGRGWYNIVLGGGGIRMPIGEYSGISLIVLWGLNSNAQMLYSNPEVRFNIDF